MAIPCLVGQLSLNYETCSDARLTRLIGILGLFARSEDCYHRRPAKGMAASAYMPSNRWPLTKLSHEKLPGKDGWHEVKDAVGLTDSVFAVQKRRPNLQEGISV